MKNQKRALTVLLSLAIAASADASSFTTVTATAISQVNNTDTGPLTASVSATANVGVGDSRATAAMGSLGGFATTTGCGPDPLFQQVCNASGTHSEFDDTIHVLGGTDGTPVTIELDWAANGTVNGTGFYGLGATLVAGNTAVSISNTSGGDVETFSNQFIGGSKSLIVNTAVGSTVGIIGWLDLGVGNRFCWGGGQFCDASLSWSITADASHTAALTAKVLSGGSDVQLIGDSGHNYLGTAAIDTPEPGTLSMFGMGVLGLSAALRRRKSARK